jgi:hypothetical protein
MPHPSGETVFSPEDPFGPEPKQQALFSGGPSDDGGEPGKTGVASPRAEDIPGDPAASGLRDDQGNDEVSVLRERLAKQDELLERMLSQRNGDITPQNRATPPAQEAMQPPGPQPDAVTKPAEFAQWLDKKLSYERQLTERGIQAREQQQEFAGNLDRLWQRFQREYAEESSDEDLVAAAFQRVVTKNGGRMPSDTESLLSMVAKQVQSWRGTTPRKTEDPPKGRTGGVGAGAGPKKSVPSKESAGEEKPKRFVDQLGDLQLKTGFF